MNRWRRNCWNNYCQCDGRNNSMSNNKKFSKDCYCDNSKWEKKQEFTKNCCCCQCEDKYYDKKEKFPKHQCECCSEYDNKEYGYDYDNNYFECNNCYEQY